MLRPVGTALIAAMLILGGAAPAIPESDGRARLQRLLSELLAGKAPPNIASDVVEAGNRLMDETTALLLRAAVTDSPGDRVALYERALDNLDEIVEQYPWTDFAIRLAGGDQRGEGVFATVRYVWRLSIAERCIAELDRLCVLGEALEISKADEDTFRCALLTQAHCGLTQAIVAEGQARAGAFEQAFSTAHVIADPHCRAVSLAEIGGLLNDAGAGSRAEETILWAARIASAIRDPFDRSRAFATVARVRAEMGDVSGARRSVQRATDAAKSLENVWEQALALTHIGLAQAKAGDFEESRKVLDNAHDIAAILDDHHSQISVIIALALAQAETGDESGARQSIAETIELTNSIRRISELFVSDTDLWTIAQAQARTGDIDQAIATAESIRDQDWRALAHAEIAAAQFRLGNPDAARETAITAFTAVRNWSDSLAATRFLATVGRYMSL